jgi:hypothetical protein
MTADLQTILESKRRYRQHLAARPIAEKLRMLDALRERALLLRPDSSSIVREEPTLYHTEREKCEFRSEKL